MSAAETAPAPAPVAVDPVVNTVDPAAAITEASADPIRPTGTDALTAESRPEATGEQAVAAAVAENPTEEKVGTDAVKIEATPVTEGTLSYKGAGLLKGLISSFNKKHFWLGDEAVSHESLSAYLKAEKDEKIGHHNVAHASETGKGLLFFSKRAEDKSNPEGVINLADASEVTREPGNRFSFKTFNVKHSFHAASTAELDGWVVAVETAIKDAVANKETVAGSENYKSTKGKLGKGAAVGTATGAATGAAVTKDDKVHDGTTPAEATATTAKEEKPRSSSKGRSQSRKRASIFGLIGKKDDSKAVEKANEKEAKKEEKEAEKEAKKEEKEAKKEEKEAEKEEKASEAKFHENRKAEEVAAAAVATSATGAAVEKVEEPSPAGIPTSITESTPPAATEAAAATTTTTTSPTTAKASKRSSVFGFFGKKSGDVPTTKDTAKDTPPAVPAKDVPATSSTAPQLDPVDTTTESAAVAPASEAVAAPAAVESTQAKEPHHNPLAPVENTPEAKAANKQKEGGDLFSFMKKKKAEHDQQKAIDTTEGVAAAEKTEGTSASPASPASPATEKRRSSFFGVLGGDKKERGTSPDGEKKGLGGIFRKASKSQKPATGPVTDSSAPPAIPKTEEAAVESETAKTEEPVVASTEAAPVAESAAKTEIPTAGTTGTDGLPTTEPVTTEAAPVAAATA